MILNKVTLSNSDTEISGDGNGLTIKQPDGSVWIDYEDLMQIVALAKLVGWESFR
jgi:hypothetical protein